MLCKSPSSDLEEERQIKYPIAGIGNFIWWLLPDSNWGHAALQAAALPTELKSQISITLS